MPTEKASALVLRTVEFSESSVIASLFTREYGGIHVLAKGGRRIKGPFESALDLMARIRVVFIRKSSGALDLLTEARIERRFRPQKNHLAGLYAGYYVIELLDQLVQDDEPEPELFDLADETLEALPNADDVTLWVSRFELQMLAILGHLPSLAACVECGGPIPEAGKVAFGHQDGGALCKRCRPGKRFVASVDREVLRIMQTLSDATDTTWRQLRFAPRAKGELRGVLNYQICQLLDKKPRMHDHLDVLFGGTRNHGVK